MENNSTTPTQTQKVDSLSETTQPNTDAIQPEPQSSVEAWTPDNSLVDSEVSTAGNCEINENAVIDAISTVYDPEIPVNVYELGLIYAVDLHDDGRVNVEMTLTAPNCPSAQELPIMIQQAIEKVPGVTQVQVEVVWDPPWDISRMSDEARLTLNMF